MRVYFKYSAYDQNIIILKCHSENERELCIENHFENSY